jgi:uncharacterized protein (TIGR02246 family)
MCQARFVMRTLALAIVCCSVTLPVFAQADRGGSTGDAAIRDLVRRYVDARDKRDPKLLEALFTEDADQLVTTGEWRQGRASVVKGGLASSQANPGSRTITIETVRMIAPGVAIADGRYDIGGTAGAAPRKMRTTFVITRDSASVWRIAAIRNMAPTDPAR